MFVRLFIVCSYRMPASKARDCSCACSRALASVQLADFGGVLFVHFAQTRAEKHFLLAGNFNKAVSGGFASPFGAGGGLEDSLMEGDDSAYPSGF